MMLEFSVNARAKRTTNIETKKLGGGWGATSEVPTWPARTGAVALKAGTAPSIFLRPDTVPRAGRLQHQTSRSGKKMTEEGGDYDRNSRTVWKIPELSGILHSWPETPLQVGAESRGEMTYKRSFHCQGSPWMIQDSQSLTKVD